MFTTLSEGQTVNLPLPPPGGPNPGRDSTSPTDEPRALTAATRPRLIQLHRENHRLLAEAADALVQFGTALDYLGRTDGNAKLGRAILEHHWRRLGALHVAMMANDDEARHVLEPPPTPVPAAGLATKFRWPGLDLDN